MAGYTRVQRKDKGFDFFDNRGKKINVDQYVQATGSNKHQLVNDMAKAGDRYSQSFTRIPEKNRQKLFEMDAQIQKDKGEIFNPLRILGDVGKATADVGKGIVGFAQQGAGVLGDVATQGGAVVGRLGVQTNPFTNQEQKNSAVKRFDQRLIDPNSVTNQLRTTIHNQKDINGNQIVGTSDVDQNAANIAMGRGNLRDYAAVLGKSLDAATTATMFASPTAIARGLAGNNARQVLNFAGKDALMYGGVDAAAGFGNTYGQTGDFGKSVQQGAIQGAVSGLTQGTLDGLGFAMRKTPQAVANAPQTARNVVQAANNTRPSVIARQDPRVMGFDEQYAQLAQQFDSLPAGSPQRTAVSRAMAQNRAERLGTLRGVQREIGQGGYIAGPGAWGFKQAQADGRVFDGVDGKPRFEVSDEGSKIKNPNGKTLEEYLDHPELFNQYPQLRKTPVVLDDIGDGVKGSFDGKELRLSPRAHKNNKELLSTALHETQHNIQDIEGFAKGGDSAGFAGMDELRADNSMLKTELNAINRKLEDADDLGWSDSTLIEGKTVGELRADKKRFEKSLKETSSQLDNYRNPHEQYKALAGEAEARAVQARMDMPMSERYKPEHGKNVEIVPTDELVKYAEFDRKSAPILSKEQYANLKADIAENGIKEPIILTYGAKDRIAAVGEGNHRLAIAKELGIKEVPVEVSGTGLRKDDQLFHKRGFAEVKGREPDESGYVPSNQKPSDIGIKSRPQDSRTTFYDSLDVPKEDLIIRNDGGKAMSVEEVSSQLEPPTTKLPQEPLPQPAKKLPNQEQSVPLENSSQPLTPDTPVQGGRTYSQDTPEIDTKQYVDELNNTQKSASKGGSKLKTAGSDFKASMIDDLSPIEDRLNKAIKEGSQVDPKDHITYQLDRSRRAEGITHAYIKDNGLDKIIQDVDNVKEFDQYLIARHANELDESIRTGRNAQKDAQLVKQLDAKYGPIAEKVYEYNRKLLDTSVEYGLINKRTAAALKKQYPDYVPLNRIFNEEELTRLHGNAKADASISKQTAIQKLKGSDRAISSPLNSIIDKTRVVVEQGERNKAAKMLADYRDLEGNPFNLKEISPSETIGNRTTISYLDAGKKRTFEVDEDIAEAAKHMSREQIGLIGRIVAVPARVLRAGATGVNAGFAGANIAKDYVGAAILSKNPIRVADPAVVAKALSAALHHNGKHYLELMREGVAGTSFDMYRNPLKSNIGEIRSQKNLGTRTLHNLLPQHWYRTLENTIGRSEDFGRAIQYYSNKAGFKAEGKSDDIARLLAGDQARNNSTNFFRSGSAGKHANLAIPYFNAGIQGSRIGIRRIKERPAQTLGMMTAAIIAPSTMIALNNYSDENRRAIMDQIPEYEKKGNIIILGANPTYNEETREWDDVYKLPVPPQHTGIHQAVQKAVESAKTGKEYDLVGVLGGIAENYATIDPTDGRAIANKLTPQAVKLIAEPMTNTNFFTGNKIIPDSQKNLPAKDQVGLGTSGTAKVIGGLTNQSPRAIDNTIRTAMGGAGQNLVNLTDTGLATIGAIGKDEIRGTSVPKSVAGRFVGADRVQTSEKIEKQFAGLKAQVTESEAYKQASTYDKQRMLNRLETDISAIEYAADGLNDKKLTKKQQDLTENGFKLNTYTNLDSKVSEETKLDPNSASYSFLDSLPDMTDSEKTTWRTQKVDEKSQGVIDSLNKMLPSDLPKFENEKATNAVAELYANYQKKKADEGWSTLRTSRERKKLIADAYKSQLTENERYISSMSDKDILTAVKTGEVTQRELEKIISTDDILVKLGLTPLIGNKTRYALGYKGTSKSGKSGGRAKSFAKEIDQLASINKLRTKTSSDLLDLLGSTTIKAKSTTPQTQKLNLKKITVKG